MHRSTRQPALMYGIGAAAILIALPAIGLALYFNRSIPGPQAALAKEPGHTEDEEPSSTPSVYAVDVVHPRRGMDYEVEQPGSVHAYETVQLHAKVSGFLSWQKVDI